MKDILIYLKDNISTFEKKKIGQVDALVFAWLSYYRMNKGMYRQGIFERIKLKDFYNAKYFDALLYDIFDKGKSKEMLSLIAANPRFRDVEMFYYVDKSNKKIEKQFSAMTFKIYENNYIIAYRGTDHSFVGWKEDFNMSFIKTVPAQIEAKKYAESVMSKVKGNFYLAGHSKGGNLATYVGSFIDSKYCKRIKKIYNFDGPNLNVDLIKDNNYRNVNDIIEKYVPQSSVVGMCFDNTYEYKIIKSNAIGVLQHSPFSWEVSNGKLKALKDTVFYSKVFKKTVNSLIDSLTKEELRKFVNSIYSVVEKTNVDTFEGMIYNLNKTLPLMYKSFNNMSNEQRTLLSKITNMFFKEIFRSMVKEIRHS